MKLVLATPLYPPEGGGPSTFARTLEIELPKYGWNVTLVKFRDVRHLPKIIRHLAYGYRVWKAALTADAVLVLDPVSVGLPALAAAWLSLRPFFLRVGGDYAWEQGMARWGITDPLDAFVLGSEYPVPVRLLKKVEALVARSARRVLVPGTYLAGIVVQWGVPPARVITAYNPAPQIVSERNCLLDKPYIISVGRLVPQKGMNGVINAFATIAREDRELRLVIVDDGPERPSLTALVHERDLAERVIFTGNVPNDTVLSWLRYAEAFILNSRYECVSHLVLEAFAVGTPVLASDVPGDVEIAIDRTTALLFGFDDRERMAASIREIRADAALRERIVSNAHALEKEFTVDRMMAAVIAALSV
ncbi:MAG: glycosyltransferase family 4 protein [Minisyncoccia bacterium]